MAYHARRAAADIRRFASEHRLTYATGASFPRSTFALMRPRARAHSLAAGQLSPGLEGLMADYGFMVKEGNRQVERHTLVLLTRLPETVNFVPFLVCHDVKAGGVSDLVFNPGGPITSFGPDGLGTSYRTVEFESLKLESRYRVAVTREQDENWLRQLFDPIFIDWLASDAPEGCYFELIMGTLCASSSEEPGAPGSLERLCSFAAYVAERLRSEVGESEATSMVPPPPFEARPADQEKLDRRVDRVAFKTPPPSVRAAAKRYFWAAVRRPGTWLRTLLIDVVIVAFPTTFVTLIATRAHQVTHVAPGWLVAVAVFSALLLLLLPLSLRTTLRYESVTSGFEAFMRGYAASFNLTSVDTLRYRSELARLRLPGGAFRVLSGTLPGGVEGTLLAFRQQRGVPDWRYGALAATACLSGEPALPAIWASPKGSREGFTMVGGFVLEEVTGLDRFRTGDDLGLDPRLSEHYDLVVDEAVTPAEVQSLLTPEFVSWLLPQGRALGLGFTLQGSDMVVFTRESELIGWSTADLDAVCAGLAFLRQAVVSAGT